MDPRQELRDAIELLANLTEAFTAALFLRDPSGKKLRPVVWQTLSRSFRSSAEVEPGEGVVGHVAKHGVVVDVDRYQQASTATGLYSQEEQVKAFLALPVGEVGVLVVDTKSRPVFGEREKKTMRDFARFMANLVRHWDTFSREAMYGRILDLLYDVENASLNYQYARQFYAEVLEAGLRFTGLTMGVLCLLYPGRKQYTVEAALGPSLATLRGRSFPVSQGLLGWILREARPLAHSRFRPLKGKAYLITPDEPMAGYNAFVGAPLLAWRRLAGVWAFAGSTERRIEQEEERALQLAGHRLAATLEHYRLS
ncbi:MAG: GAF domain-containing protein [Desulfarculaceae bacterium]|jgi:signal transduction protein with GAF and PtsI domain